MTNRSKTTTLTAKIMFDQEVSGRLLDGFVEPLRELLEFGDLQNERYRKSGWGMGTALVVKVRRAEEPDPTIPSRDLFVTIQFKGLLPDDRAAERFADLLTEELTAKGDRREAWGMGVARVVAMTLEGEKVE